MHVRLRELLRRQGGLVAAWQLLALGWTRGMIEHAVRANGWQVIHPGVYAVSPARLSRWQRWGPATLTTPSTFLGGACAAALFGYRPDPAGVVTVVRPGSGGRRRHGLLLVSHSTTLEAHTTSRDGLPVVTAARALVDVAPALSGTQLGRAFRESIRLKTTAADQIARTVGDLRGRRGTASLAALCDRYAVIPYHRCRSDPEGRALEILHDARVQSPKVNIEVAGREADLVWPSWKLIIELDSREFHQFADQDRIKERRWKSAGYRVRRLYGPLLYEHPQRLLAEVNVHLAHL